MLTSSQPTALPWREAQRARLRKAALTALRPPPDVTVSEWADQYRELSSSQSALAGRWRTSETPYLREIMDALSPNSPVQTVYVMKGARVGYTEGPINNTVGAYMHMAPCPMMVGQPSEGDGEEWSKDSLDPMLASTSVLRGLVTPDGERKKGNTIMHKRYRGGVIYVVGASTGKSFRRRLGRLLIGDEIDGWPGSIDGEGDPWGLFLKRGDTFGTLKKVLGGSTPTVKGYSRVERLFLTSDQRYFHVPCPECGHMQQLIWENFHWTDNDAKTTEYACAKCSTLIPDHKKRWMLDRGRWVPTFPEREARGYHISAFYSPWVGWPQIVAEWLAAEGDPTLEQVWTNTVKGETWDLANAERWSLEDLRALCVPLVSVPRVAACLTAGVDVQGDRLVLVVDAWGPNEERWTLLRRDLLGDPTGPEVWEDLDAALLDRYALEGGGTVAVKAACVDSGFQAQEVKAFCKRRVKRRVTAIKGREGQGVPVWPRESKTRNKGRADVVLIGIDAAKEAMHARLRRSAQGVAGPGRRGGPGFWHFANTLTEAFFEELTAEVQVVEHSKAKRGGTKAAARRRWMLRKPGLRNESLDCCVYSYGALCGLLARGAVNLEKPLVGKDVPATFALSREVVSEKRISSRSSNLERREENAKVVEAVPSTPVVEPQRVAPPALSARVVPEPKKKRPRFF